MNKIIIAIVLLFAVSSINTQEDDGSFSRYEAYIQKFGKKFASLDDLTKHYQAYKTNMDHVNRLNSEAPVDEGEESVFGETEFSDMEPEEFQQKYLTFTLPEGVDVNQLNEKDSGNTETEKTPEEGAEPSTAEPADSTTGRHLQQEDEHTLRNLQSIPTSFDWRSKGAVGPVKNQGACGACWAFATVGNIEGLYYRKYGVLKNFSEQNLIDCSTANYGCNGGFFEKAMAYIKNAGGLQQTSDYGSYRAYRKTCAYNRTKAIAKVKSWVFVGSNEVTIRNYLYNNGPISVAFNASNFQNYRGGVYTASCSRTVNHGVTLVGYGSQNGIDYWIVKNSWGANWGEKGFFRIRRGVGLCGINTYVVSAVLA